MKPFVDTGAALAEAMHDPLDRALLGQTPTVMMPHKGRLPPLEPGRHRFIAGRNGFYVEGRTHALSTIVPITYTPQELPYGPVEPHVTLMGGMIPDTIVQAMKDRAAAACPDEWAGLVMFDPDNGQYELVEPPVQSVSQGHITYDTQGIDWDRVALDVHSHGSAAARFSVMDDADDRQRGWIMLAGVIGHCHRPDLTRALLRVCIHGFLHEMHYVPWQCEALPHVSWKI